MKDYISFPPLNVSSASGDFLITENGQRIIDVVSSWWCKSLGHGNVRIGESIYKQSKKFEHVILANTTNENIQNLSETLCLLCGMDKAFYGSDGSTAVEIALKMSIQANYVDGNVKKNKVAYLQNSYHGENIFIHSVSDLSLYSKPYADLSKKNVKLDKIEYVNNVNEKKKLTYWQEIEKKLEKNKERLASIIVEPIVQGAAGMKIYSPNLLSKLSKWAKKNNVYLIVDEVMTGLGRTGKVLASNYAKIKPDFICLMKNLTAGWLPLSVVLTKNKIYQKFYDDYETGKAFMHSNTFSGNALGVAAALEVLKIYKEDNLFERVEKDSYKLTDILKNVNEKLNCFENIRGIGFIAAADLKSKTFKKKRWGYQIYQEAVKLGLLLRPLGDTIYLLPPFNVKDSTLEMINEIIPKAIQKTL